MFAQNWKKLNTSQIQNTTSSSDEASDISIINDIKSVLITAINCIYGTSQTDNKYLKIVDLILLRITALIKETSIPITDAYEIITSTIEQFFLELDKNLTDYSNVVLNSKENILALTNNITENLSSNKETEDNTSEETITKENTDEELKKDNEETKNLSITEQLQLVNDKIVQLEKNTNIVQFIQNFFDKNFGSNKLKQNKKNGYEPIKITKALLNDIKLNILFVIELNKTYISFVQKHLNSNIALKIEKITDKQKDIYKLAKKTFVRKTIFDYVIDYIKDKFKKRFTNSITKKNSFFGQFINVFTNPFQSISDFIVNKLSKRLGSRFSFKSLSDTIETIKNILRPIWYVVKKTLNLIVRLFIKSVQFLLNTAHKLISTLFNILKTIFNYGRQFITNIVNAVSRGISAAKTFLSNTKVGSRIANIFNKAKDFLSKRTSQLKTFFKNAFSKPAQFFKNLAKPFQNLRNSITNFVKNFKNSCKTLFKSVKNSIVNAVKNTGKAIARQFKKIGQKMVKAITKKIGPAVAKLFAKTAGKKAGKSLGKNLIKKFIKFIVKKILKKVSVKMLSSLVLSLLSGPIGIVLNIIMMAYTIYDLFVNFVKPLLDNVMKYYTFTELKNIVYDFVMEQITKIKEAVTKALKAGLEWFEKCIIGFVKSYLHAYVAVFNFFTGNRRVNTSNYEKDIQNVFKTETNTFMQLDVVDKLKLLDNFNMEGITQFINEINRLSKAIADEEDSWFPSTKLINKLTVLRQKNFLILARKLGKYGITSLDKDTLDNLPQLIAQLRDKIWNLNYKAETIALEQSLTNKLDDLKTLSDEIDNIKNESNADKFKLKLKDLKRLIYSKYMSSNSELLMIQ